MKIHRQTLPCTNWFHLVPNWFLYLVSTDLLQVFHGWCQTHASIDDHLQLHETPFPMCSPHSFLKRHGSSYPSSSKVSSFFCCPTVGCSEHASPPSFFWPPQEFLEELGAHRQAFSTTPLLNPLRFQPFHHLHGLGYSCRLHLVLIGSASDELSCPVNPLHSFNHFRHPNFHTAFQVLREPQTQSMISRTNTCNTARFKPPFARDNRHKKNDVSSCGYTWLISCLTHTPWEWNRQRKLDFRSKQFRR